SGRNAIENGWFSPFVTVILIGRTRPVSSEIGPSGIGGDGQLIGGGAVALPRPAAGACWAASGAMKASVVRDAAHATRRWRRVMAVVISLSLTGSRLPASPVCAAAFAVAGVCVASEAVVIEGNPPAEANAAVRAGRREPRRT